MKTSTAFVPPEMIYTLVEHNKRVPYLKKPFSDDRDQQTPTGANIELTERVSVTELDGEEKDALSSDPLLAHESFDMWSLGVILFEMCTGNLILPVPTEKSHFLNNSCSSYSRSFSSFRRTIIYSE
jgi:serine/threonine protein kinase